MNKTLCNSHSPSYDGDWKTIEMVTSILPLGTIGSVASFLAAILYLGNLDKFNKLLNIVST